MKENGTITRGFSLTKIEMNIIERVSKERFLMSGSAALRQIIREWDETQRGKTEAVEDIASDAFNYSE